MLECCIHIAMMENSLFIVFDFVFSYNLMPHNMITLYFHLPYFHVSSSALILHSTLIFSFT